MVQRLSQSDEAFCCIALHSLVPTSTDEPSLQEALSGDHAKEWQDAIDTELAGMKGEEVLKDVPLPPGRKPVGTKFVLKIKRSADSTVERFKARLVAQGSSQQQGIDYGQTFRPVVAADVLRTILALAAANSWDVQALDFTQAYLNADIDANLWVSLSISIMYPTNSSNLEKLTSWLFRFRLGNRPRKQTQCYRLHTTV